MDVIQQDEPQGVIEDDVDSASATENESEVITDGDQSEGDEAHLEDRVTFDERQQAKVDGLISDKVRKQREAERRAEEAEAKLAEIEASKPKPTIPEIPELPEDELFYENPAEYRRLVGERDKAIAERAEMQAEQRARQQLQEQQEHQRQAEQLKQNEQAQSDYQKRATDFGFSEDSMMESATEVAKFVSPELGMHLVKDSHGPLVVDYLAKNLGELDKVRNMSPVDAAVYIATEVKPKVSSTRKTTSAPKPASIVDGGGAPAKEHPALAGVTFE